MKELFAWIAVCHLLDEAGEEHEAAHEAVDERALFSHCPHDPRKHLVEEERHTEEHGDPGFPEVTKDLFRRHAFAKDNFRTHGEAFDKDGKHRVGMMDRKQGVEDVCGVD